MCGIAGIIGEFDGATEHVRRMLALIAHRGDRDKTGSYHHVRGAVLGCNRLAIVDRAGAHQPMADASGGLVVAFNGQIYNHDQLRDQLASLGCVFRTRSDTEVLLHAYRTWGPAMVDRFDGMFAFVVFDTASQRVFAARDPMGVKPLYCARSGVAWLFASELKCLAPFGAPIDVVPPGHYYADGQLHRYFELTKRAVPQSDPEAVLGFRRHFEEAVRKRVATDLPIGVIFSGGLDSAAVLAMALRHHPDVTAYTVGFRGAPDVEVARRFCEERGIRQRVEYLELDALSERLPRVVYSTETFEVVDIMDASVMGPAYGLAARDGVKVVLTGDGSDEALAGYDFFKTHPDPEALMTYRLSNLHRTDLQRVDRASMAHTVEARVPFLDKAYLGYVYSLPMSLKIKDGIEKWVLRAAVDDVLPAYLAWRPKIRMPEGTGLLYQLLDYAGAQPNNADPALLDHLGIDRPEGAYVLDLYLRGGFPTPRERYKKPHLDFSPNGYFQFGAASLPPVPLSGGRAVG